MKTNCEICKFQITEDDEFCPNCGELLQHECKCLIHPENSAEGVCVICAQPFCGRCIAIVNKKVLCEEHKNLEIFDRFVKVFSSRDDLQIEFVKNCLEQNGLHPVLFNAKSGAFTSGIGDYSFCGSFMSNNIKTNELKLLVPFQEMNDSLEIIKELKVSGED